MSGARRMPRMIKAGKLATICLTYESTEYLTLSYNYLIIIGNRI